MNYLDHSEADLSAKIRDKQVDIPVWAQPDEFDFSSWADRSEVSRRFEDGRIKTTIDRSTEIASDLFSLRHPDQKLDTARRAEFVGDITARGLGFGRWFNFSWNQQLVRYPEQSDHEDLRTYRNKDMITDAEQKKLLMAKVAVFGLSVGSSVVEQLAMGGIGGTFVLGDFDKLSPTNLNRIRAGFDNIGMEKIDIAAIKLSETDPYIAQVHFRDGVNGAHLDELAEIKPDVIFDEIDNLAIKALLRQFAQKNHIPLIMATDVGDKSVIDVERYDRDGTKPFNGKLSDSEIDKLLSGAMTDADRQKLTMRIVGLSNISPRLIGSSMKIGESLDGLPQLGTTANIGGSLGAVAARELLIGRKLESGKYVSSAKRILGLQNQTSLSDTAKIIRRFTIRRITNK
jgi:molybdopterin/thiamine biosynthesis adenylyltransferase